MLGAAFAAVRWSLTIDETTARLATSNALRRCCARLAVAVDLPLIAKLMIVVREVARQEKTR